ncbi:MAG: type III-B CRISPR module-associated protein Cmr5 [Caldilineaceae bacterium]
MMTEQQKKLPQQQKTEQARATAAWSGIDEIENSYSSEKKKYGTLARKLPAMIQSNGLGQTLAFLRAKGGKKSKDAHNLIADHLGHWVKNQLKTNHDQDLLTWIIQQSSDDYRRATTESIAFAIWLRRFAEAKDWGETGGDL